jgi:hypothetical protein
MLRQCVPFNGGLDNVAFFVWTKNFKAVGMAFWTCTAERVRAAGEAGVGPAHHGRERVEAESVAWRDEPMGTPFGAHIG